MESTDVRLANIERQKVDTQKPIRGETFSIPP